MTADKSMLNDLRIHRERDGNGKAGAKPPWARLPVVLGAVILVVLLGLMIWWMTVPTGIAVHTARVRQINSATSQDTTLLNASGYVTARRRATVAAKVTGKVTEVLVEEGMKVAAGQVVARLDSSNVETSLKLAEAQLESAKRNLGETQTNLEQARREWKRLSKLMEEKAVTQLEGERAEVLARALDARLTRQSAEVAVADSEILVWKQQLDDTIVRAPFAGVVTSKDAQPGEMVSPVSAGGGFTRTGICTIVDMASLEIEVDVSESYINRVEPGQTVTATLDAYPDWQIPAKVVAIIPTADRQKATVKVRIAFDKLDPRILPEMSVKAAFKGAGETTAQTVHAILTVPKSALGQADGHDIVWVVRDGGKVERRAVKVGAAPAGDEATVFGGLTAGEQVVTENIDGLTDGAWVRVIKP